MTAIATIKHSDESRSDRVTLYYVAESPWVWAAAYDEEPYETNVPLATITSAWGDKAWDLERT